jgi:hypothetical protein
MSDQSTTSQVVANATQALAIKELSQKVSHAEKQVKALWITVAVVGVIALVGFIFTMVPSLRFSMMGGQLRTRTFNGQQFNGATGTGAGAQGTQGTTTGQ